MQTADWEQNKNLPKNTQNTVRKNYGDQKRSKSFQQQRKMFCSFSAFDRTHSKSGNRSGLLCNKLYKIYRSVFKDVAKMARWKKQWSTLLTGDKLLFFGFNLVRFVSFYFVYLFFFSFVEDILKQYLKDENCHYHFPFSFINSNVGQYSCGLNSNELYMSFEIKKRKSLFCVQVLHKT